MQLSDETIAWAIKKLSRFKGWQGFPQDAEGIKGRARSFLRLVHNQTAKEIMEEKFRREGKAVESIQYKLQPDLNDADWVLDLIEETMEQFPLPVQMRRLYLTKLPAASSMEGAE